MNTSGNANPDAGGRAARSALLDLIAEWRKKEPAGVLTELGLCAERQRQRCADELEDALEAAGLAAGDRPQDLVHQCSANVRHRFVSDYAVRCPLCELERLQVEHRVLQQAAGDPSLCRECLGCGSYVSARNIVEGRDPNVECDRCHGTGLAAGERPSLDQQVAELEAWKAKEQQFLRVAAAELLTAGFKGAGILDGIRWLKESVNANLDAMEERPRLGCDCGVDGGAGHMGPDHHPDCSSNQYAVTGDRPSLFQSGDFTLHSGEHATWKIDCDALTDADVKTLARMLMEVLPPFGSVEGVPRGGLRLAHHLESWVVDDNHPLLIVDDVATTGASMEQHRAGRAALGCVVFARGPVPSWVTPLFTMAAGDRPSLDALDPLERQRWLAHHVDQGHGITRLDAYDECSCGATYWRVAGEAAGVTVGARPAPQEPDQTENVDVGCGKPASLHPLDDPLGDSHHTDVPMTQADLEIGERLSCFLGDLFVDSRTDSPRVQWRRVARALRVHGLQIIDAPDRALPVSSPAPAMPLQHTDLFQVGVMLGYLARWMREKKYARVNVPCEYRGDRSGGFDRFTVDDVELASAELFERYTKGSSK